MRLFGVRLPMMSSLILWCVLWEVAGRLDLVFLLPPFSAVLVAMTEIVPTAGFLRATWLTLGCFALGMALAVLVGVPLGVLMGRSRAADRLLGLWVNLFLSAPLSALVPILMILFGLGTTTIVATVFLFAVWIITLDTQAGVRSVAPSLLEMARTYGAGRVALYRRVILPAALPEILAGVRLGVIRGVKGVVIGQLLVSIVGYGALFELYSRSFLMEEFWALTILLFAFALVLADLVGRLEKRVEFYAGAR
ncbi:MAG: ABC transporter permease subunit [Geminicoccaceae bacterium]|nr:ABC transporter permease subunit [Geminicoccaceae bacterium]